MPAGTIMAASALAQFGLGAYQMYKGAQAKKEAGARPEYETPQEILQSLNLAQRQAYEGLPAEQKQQFVENLRAMQATGLSQLSDRKSGLAGVGNLTQQALAGTNSMFAQDAAARQQNIQRYQNQLEMGAGYKDLEFQTNQLQPYQQSLAESKAMTGSGIQNTFGAIGGLGQAAAYLPRNISANKFQLDPTLLEDPNLIGDNYQLGDFNRSPSYGFGGYGLNPNN